MSLGSRRHRSSSSGSSTPPAPVRVRGWTPQRGRRHPARADHVCELVDVDLVPGPGCERTEIWLAIVPEGTNSAASLPQHRGDLALELDHGRVVAVDVVADHGRGHRLAHRGRRAGDGVGAKVDRAHGRAAYRVAGGRRTGSITGRCNAPPPFRLPAAVPRQRVVAAPEAAGRRAHRRRRRDRRRRPGRARRRDPARPAAGRRPGDRRAARRGADRRASTRAGSSARTSSRAPSSTRRRCASCSPSTLARAADELRRGAARGGVPDARGAAARLPTPPPFHNKGNHVFSLARLGALLAEQAEELGVMLLPETDAQTLLVADGAVRRRAHRRQGRSRDGEPGAELRARRRDPRRRDGAGRRRAGHLAVARRSSTSG